MSHFKYKPCCKDVIFLQVIKVVLLTSSIILLYFFIFWVYLNISKLQKKNGLLYEDLNNNIKYVIKNIIIKY